MHEHQQVNAMDELKAVRTSIFRRGIASIMSTIVVSGLLVSFVCVASVSDASGATVMQTAPTFAYVGCYTSKERNGHGEGINVFQIDGTGNWTLVQLYKDFNPSFLTFDRKQQFLYAVHGDGDKISAFKIDKQTGKITLLNEQPTNGKNGVALAVDPTNRFIVMANYSSGTLASLPIKEDGSLGPVIDLVTLPGDIGPNRFEQTLSHPHHVRFDSSDRFIMVPDKGLDKIFVFQLDAATGKLVPNAPPSVTTRTGAGPRHLDPALSKPFVYVVNELDSSVTTYQFDGVRGALKPVQIIPTLPTTFTGNSVSAEIVVAPSAKMVYASNRGHDSITIFSIDETNGTLKVVGWEPTQGKTPRFFAVNPLGTTLYVANQDSDTIVAFRILPNDKLVPTGQVIKTGSPSSIIFTK